MSEQKRNYSQRQQRKELQTKYNYLDQYKKKKQWNEDERPLPTSGSSNRTIQLKAIETALDYFIVGQSIAKQFINKVSDHYIKEKLNNLVYHYYNPRDIRLLKKEIGGINDFIIRILNDNDIYHPSYDFSFPQIDNGFMKDIIKVINQYKIIQHIIIHKQALKPTQYLSQIRNQSFSLIKEANSLAQRFSAQKSSSHLEDDISYEFNNLINGKFDPKKSKLSYWNPKIHNYFVELNQRLCCIKDSPVKSNRSNQFVDICKNQRQQIKQLRNQLKNNQEQIAYLDDLNKQLSEKARKGQQIYFQNQQLIKEVNHMTNKIANYEILLTKVQKLEKKEAELKSQIEIANRHQLQFKEYKSSFSNFQKEKIQTDEQLKKIREDYMNLMKKYQTLLESQEKLKKKVAKHQQNIQRQSDINEIHFVQRISLKQFEIQSAKRESEKKQVLIQEISNKLNLMQNEKESEIKDLQKKIEDHQQQINLLVKQNDILAVKCFDSQIKIENKVKKSYQSILEYLKTENLSLQQVIFTKNRQIKRIKSTCNDFIKEQQRTIFCLKAQLSQIQKIVEKSNIAIKCILQQWQRENTKLFSNYKVKLCSQFQAKQLKIKAQYQKDLEFTQENANFLQQQAKEIKIKMSRKEKQITDLIKFKEQYFVLLQENKKLKEGLLNNGIFQDKSFQQINKKDEQIKDLTQHLNKLNKKLQQVMSEFQLRQKELNERITKEHGNHIQVVAQLEEMRRNERVLIEEHNLNINSLASQLSQHKKDNQQLKSTNLKLDYQIQEISQINRNLQSQKQKYQIQNRHLSQEKDKNIILLRQLQRKCLIFSQRKQEKEEATQTQQAIDTIKQQTNLQQEHASIILQMKLLLEKQKESNNILTQSLQQQSLKYIKILKEKQKIETELQRQKQKSKQVKNGFSLQQKQKMQKRIKNYKEEIDHLTAQIDMLNENLMEITKINLQSTPQPEEQINQQQYLNLKINNNTNKEQLLQKQEKNRQLRLQIDNLREDKRALENQITRLNQQTKFKIQELERKNGSLLSQHYQASRSFQDLQSRYYQINQKVQAQSVELLEKQRTINSLLVSKERSNVENDLLFQNQVLEGQIEHKKYLRTVIQDYMRFKIWKTKLLFRYDVENKVNFHRYIDKKEHIVLVMKLKNGNYLAAYSQGSFQPQKTSNQDALIISVTNQEAFTLVERNRRGITYDDYYIIFGNSEIRLKSQENKIFSNFAISNGYFAARGKKVSTLLGGGPSQRQVQFQHYEIYQLEVIYEL